MTKGRSLLAAQPLVPYPRAILSASPCFLSYNAKYAHPL